MAKYRIRLLLAVAIITILGNALATPTPAFAQEGAGNPIKGNNCVFQNPAVNGTLEDHIFMDPSLPSYYQRDPVMPGLHFNGSQWAGLDIIQTELRLPFASGGKVVANTGPSYDPAGGGFGVAYEGLADCTGWITGYWHNPSPVAYEVGTILDANAPAGTPGCTGFETYCGDKTGQIPAHSHFSVGFQSIENPFPAEVPAYHTVSQNPAVGSVWWLNPLRVVPNVNPKKVEKVWYAAAKNQQAWYAATTPAQPPVNTTLMEIGVVVACVIGLFLVNGKGGKLIVIAAGIALGVWIYTTYQQPAAVLPRPTTPAWYSAKSVEMAWYSNAPETKTSVGLDQKNQANGEGWKIIQQAVKDAGGNTDRAKLLFWTWQSESSVVDCKPWETKFAADGLPNPCVSSAYAKGPFQFIDTTWAKYEVNGWDRWTLYGAARGAYEEFNRLNLWDQPDAQSFATRFSGADGGQVWNLGSAGYNQALWVFENYLTTQPNN